jgi:hypothetical protein
MSIRDRDNGNVEMQYSDGPSVCHVEIIMFLQVLRNSRHLHMNTLQATTLPPYHPVDKKHRQAREADVTFKTGPYYDEKERTT